MTMKLLYEDDAIRLWRNTYWLRFDPVDTELIEDARDIYELLEGFVCNGDYDWINPEDIGALTDADIIGVVVYAGDTDEIEDVPVVYWDEQYCIRDTMKDLVAGKTVQWMGGSDNKW